MILPKTVRKVAARRSAFTLLEVLVVVAILVILAGTAVVFIPQYLEDSKVSKAQLECKAWEDAVNKYYMQNGANGFPSSLQDQNVMQNIQDGQTKIKDPWGNMYQLEIDTDPTTQLQTPLVYTKHAKYGRITRRGPNT